MKEINSLENPLVKHWVRIRKNHDYRLEHKSVLIEGIKAVQEVCHDSPAKYLIATMETFVPGQIKADEVILVPEEVMHKISGMDSPEGLIAEVAMPPQASLEKKKQILVLDGINDPGNLGTLIRTALALGWDGAFIVENSCDPYNDKALRAAKGATFRLPLAMGNWQQLEQMLAASPRQCLAADLKGIKPNEVPSTDKRALFLGNEAHGISDRAAKFCTQVTIPISGKMESLNVSIAGGILMYLLSSAK